MTGAGVNNFSLESIPARSLEGPIRLRLVRHLEDTLLEESPVPAGVWTSAVEVEVYQMLMLVDQMPAHKVVEAMCVSAAEVHEK